jgi:hypothetical protein
VIIDSARLLDAQAFKGAISAGPADLGIIVTEDFYQNVVRNSEHVTKPRPAIPRSTSMSRGLSCVPE